MDNEELTFFGIMVAIAFVVIFLGVLADSSQCSSKANAMKLDHTYGPIQGCLVKLGDRYVPIESIRFNEQGNDPE